MQCKIKLFYSRKFPYLFRCPSFVWRFTICIAVIQRNALLSVVDICVSYARCLTISDPSCAKQDSIRDFQLEGVSILKMIYNYNYYTLLQSL